MDDMKALFEKMRAKMDMVRSVFGEENLAAVPLFENCLCYPMDLLTELAGMACEIEELDSPEEISSRLEAFREGIDGVLGKGACHVLSIRQPGGVEVVE